MEEQKNLMEHMYGELGTGHLASPAVQDEDSVDIYSGLDSSPGSSHIAEKSCTRFSPRRLKDSMDLYEEIIKEEQQEKEATCSELKKKLDAAQNQVKELLQKLEEIQLQNASLLSQNTSLKKNICALFKTARMEILRKDNEISRLSQRGGRGGYCPSFSRPQNNYQRKPDSGQNSAPTPDRAAYTENHGSKDTCIKGPPRPCSEAPGVSLQPVPRDNSLLTPPSCERNTRIETVVPSRLGEPAPAYIDRGSNIEQTLNLESLSEQTSTACPANEEKPKVCEKQPVISQDNCGKSLGSKVGDQKEQCIALDSRDEAIWSNGNKSGKEGNQSVKDGMNSSAFHVHKESKLLSRETSGKEGKRFEKDCLPSNEGRQQPSLSEPRRSLERGKSPPHLRKRSPPASSSHRTTSSSHSHKMRSKNMEQSNKSNSRESRHSHSRGGRDASRSLDREGKYSDYDRGKVGTSSSRKGSRSPRREHHRKVERSHDERSRHRESRSNVTGKNKDYDRKKGKDSDKSLKDCKVDEKKDKILERNKDLKNGRKSTFPFSADSCDLVKDSEKLKKGQGKHLASVEAKVHVLDGEELQSCAEHEAGQKSLPEESNQNRKLSFMETLNLTLSPIKKPRLSSSGNKQEMFQSEVSQGSPDEEASQFDIGEEYCVIDELENTSDSFKETDEVLKALAVGTAGICEGEKTKLLQSKHVLEKAKKENSQDKEESVAQAHICSAQMECNSESTVDRNIVFQGADSVSPATTADRTPKRARQPVECKDSDSMSKVIDGTAMTALPPESRSGATESCPKASKIPTILNTDNVHVCSSTSEDQNSLDCESSSVKPITIDSAVICGENCSPDSGKNIQSPSPTAPLALQMDIMSQDASTTSSIDHHPSRRRNDGVSAVSTEAVSSSVSVEMVSQSCDIVVPDVTENHRIPGTKPEKYAECPVTNHSLASLHSTLVTKVGSTFEVDEVVQSEEDLSGGLQAAQDCCMSGPDSTKHEEWNNRVEPSISVPVSFDEDSMMMTLKNIQPFPEAISPLTSPVRPVKRSLPNSSENSQHVRSLNKDFSTSPGARNMDVDKENEKPQCSSSQFPHMDPNSTTATLSSRTEDEYELEEGEIVSGSEEDEPPAIPSPKVRKTHTSMKKTPCPKSPKLGKMQAQKKTALISHSPSEVRSKTSTTPNSSPTSKRPRNVLPLLPKTNPSCIAEVMDMLKSIQGQLRKKYMKFHKNFPKKSFSNIIDMCLCSFTDFVNTVNLNEFCTLESILKPKLIRIISVSMSKISNNGIVNRIFEQQSPSLKKKLWAFVEDQFQFLFREIQATLTSVCELPEARNLSKTEYKERKGGNKVCKRPALPPLPAEATQKRKAAEVDVGAVSGVLSKVKPPTATPLRTGLGSRGKDLRTNKGEDKLPSEAQHSASFHSPSKTVLTPPKNAPSREKPAACVRSLSQNGSVQDKSDFELLTEQQASSLTFNLVRDSQMGEIFKCLLQGSDLLENSVSVGDAHSWPVGTPLKCSSGGESSLAVMTPKKTTLTPSKLIATWSTISPCKLPSPNPKIHIPLNPAVLDESCMLEVPSSSLPFCKGTPSSSVPSQMSYSVLAEDLAVSLTIPSPLKSDGHLSFLCPETTEPTSAPESVISAHYSEDALLDGEDATEQDIHLALDSDNSSAGSSGCKTSDEPAMPTFQFKPHLPMQAVVTEKSNDHFIVRIRHMSTSLAASTDQNLTQDSEKERQKVMETEEVSTDSAQSTPCASASEHDPAQSQSPSACEKPDLHPPTKVCLKGSLSGSVLPEKTVNCHNANAAHSNGNSVDSAPMNSVTSESASPTGLVIVTEEDCASIKSGETGKKRKKRHSERRAKRVKSEHTQEVRKLRKKSSSTVSKHMGVVTPNKERKKSPKLPPLSPNSLSAKNVIRRKGEVVVTWTRDEDRDILVELKMKGPSPDTFSALSSKIKKPPALIAERFTQLMKLFKKKERMTS